MINDRTLKICREWGVSPEIMALIIILIKGPVNERSLYQYKDAIEESKELNLTITRNGQLFLTENSVDFCKIILASFNEGLN